MSEPFNSLQFCDEPLGSKDVAKVINVIFSYFKANKSLFYEYSRLSERDAKKEQTNPIKIALKYLSKSIWLEKEIALNHIRVILCDFQRIDDDFLITMCFTLIECLERAEIRAKSIFCGIPQLVTDDE